MRQIIKHVSVMIIAVLILFGTVGCNEELPESLTEYDYKPPRPLVYDATDPLKVEQEKIDAFCGALLQEEKTNGIFRYSVYENGMQIDGLAPECDEKIIVLPDELEGKAVIGIASKAFCDNNLIKEVSFPKTIKYVGASAFKRCEELEKIKLNEGLLFVGERTFDNCKKLSEVILPDTVSYIGEYLFALSGVENVSVPAAMDRVPTGMYYGTNIKDFDMPANVVYILKSGFAKCPNLKEMTLPGTVKYIGQTAFANCINLKSMTVEKGCIEVCYGVFEGDIVLEEVYLPETVVTFSGSIFPDANKDVILYLKEGSKAEEIAISSKYNYETVK